MRASRLVTGSIAIEFSTLGVTHDLHAISAWSGKPSECSMAGVVFMFDLNAVGVLQLDLSRCDSKQFCTSHLDAMRNCADIEIIARRGSQW